MNYLKRLFALTSICLATTAGAAEIWNHSMPTAGMLRWDGFDSGSTLVDVSKSNAPTIDYSGLGGQYRGYFYTDGSASADEFFRFFCIDLFETAATGPYQYTASIYANNTLARLFDIAYPNKAAGDFYDGSAVTNFGLFSSNVYSSAFQLAVWEIYYESAASLNLAQGSFRSDIAGNASGTDAQKAVALANTWLGSLNAGAGSEAGWTLYAFVRAGRQDFVSATYAEPPKLEDPPANVPEPGTLAMLASALAMAGAFRRRQH